MIISADASAETAGSANSAAAGLFYETRQVGNHNFFYLGGRRVELAHAIGSLVNAATCNVIPTATEIFAEAHNDVLDTTDVSGPLTGCTCSLEHIAEISIINGVFKLF